MSSANICSLQVLLLNGTSKHPLLDHVSFPLYSLVHKELLQRHGPLITRFLARETVGSVTGLGWVNIFPAYGTLQADSSRHSSAQTRSGIYLSTGYPAEP
jgi:hypothetical protein